MPALTVPPALCASLDLGARPEQGRRGGALHWEEESLS